MTHWSLWVLLIIGGMAVLWWAYLWVTPEPADLPPETLASTDQDDDPDVAGWYAPLVGTSVVRGNLVEHLRNGDEIFPAMLEAIRRARGSVNLLTYVYWTGRVAQEFADVLAEAAGRGCEVRVLLDALGAYRMDDSMVEKMERGGCRVARFHPVDWYSFRRLNHRTHRKILVVDGCVGFAGGVGIAEEWEGDARDEGEWRDDHFKVTGPSVHGLQGAFAENWLHATGELLAGGRQFPEIHGQGPAAVVSVATTRREDLAPLLVLYWLVLRTARRAVDVTTPYFVPDALLVTAFCDAVRRGVRVRLLLPSDHNDSRVVRWTSKALYPRLIEAGVEVYEFSPTMIHSKVIASDERWSVVGSANFDNRSFELNHEFVMLVDDRGLNSELRASFEKDLERSRRIRLDEFEGVSRSKQWLGRVGLLLREQL